MREQGVCQRLALGQLQRCGELMAAFARELETLGRHVRPPSCWVSDRSVARIALLLPGIPPVMIAAYLPVARRILCTKFNALQPLRALPEIEVGDHQPHRAAVLGLKLRAGPAMREQGVFGGEIFEGEIG